MVITRPKPHAYRDVHEVAAPADERNAAHIALSGARHLLGLGDVRIQWFQYARSDAGRTWMDSRKLRGLTYPDTPGTIFIRAGQGVRSVVESVLHECRHLHQNRQHGPSSGSTDSQQRERDAEQFAAQYVVEYTLRVPITADVRSMS